MKKFTDPRMHDCIQHCWDCRDTCQATLYNYCLAQGGHHVEQAHVRVMEDCIQICQTAADFMTRGSDLHAAVCAECGGQALVPFLPRNDRPVYCSNCFDKVRARA